MWISLIMRYMVCFIQAKGGFQFSIWVYKHVEWILITTNPVYSWESTLSAWYMSMIVYYFTNNISISILFLRKRVIINLN